MKLLRTANLPVVFRAEGQFYAWIQSTAQSKYDGSTLLQSTWNAIWYCRYYQYHTAIRFLSASTPMNSNDVYRQKDVTVQHTRNKGLASAIRAGLDQLNQTSVQIQASKSTRKPLFSKDDNAKPDKRQVTEQTRLWRIIHETLDHFSVRNPSLFSVGDSGEPIVLLHIVVSSSLQVATVFWALPYDLWLDDDLSDEQKRNFTETMQRKLDGGAAALLQRKVHSQLRSYHPPQLRFKPAPPDMLAQATVDYTG